MGRINHIFYFLTSILFWIHQDLYAPNGLKAPQANHNEWEQVMIGYQDTKELSIKVMGKTVLCDNKIVAHGQDIVETVVTIGDKLYINGKLIDESQLRERKKAKKLAAVSNAVPAQSSLSRCAIL